MTIQSFQDGQHNFGRSAPVDLPLQADLINQHAKTGAARCDIEARRGVQ